MYSLQWSTLKRLDRQQESIGLLEEVDDLVGRRQAARVGEAELRQVHGHTDTHVVGNLLQEAVQDVRAKLDNVRAIEFVEECVLTQAAESAQVQELIRIKKAQQEQINKLKEEVLEFVEAHKKQPKQNEELEEKASDLIKKLEDLSM